MASCRPTLSILRNRARDSAVGPGPFPRQNYPNVASFWPYLDSHHLSISSLAEMRATFQPTLQAVGCMQHLGCWLHFTFTWLLASQMGVDTQPSGELVSFFILYQDGAWSFLCCFSGFGKLEFPLGAPLPGRECSDYARRCTPMWASWLTLVFDLIVT